MIVGIKPKNKRPGVQSPVLLPGAVGKTDLEYPAEPAVAPESLQPIANQAPEMIRSQQSLLPGQYIHRNPDGKMLFGAQPNVIGDDFSPPAPQRNSILPEMRTGGYSEAANSRVGGFNQLPPPPMREISQLSARERAYNDVGEYKRRSWKQALWEGLKAWGIGGGNVGELVAGLSGVYSKSDYRRQIDDRERQLMAEDEMAKQQNQADMALWKERNDQAVDMGRYQQAMEGLNLREADLERKRIEGEGRLQLGQDRLDAEILKTQGKQRVAEASNMIGILRNLSQNPDANPADIAAVSAKLSDLVDANFSDDMRLLVAQNQDLVKGGDGKYHIVNKLTGKSKPVVDGKGQQLTVIVRDGGGRGKGKNDDDVRYYEGQPRFGIPADTGYYIDDRGNVVPAPKDPKTKVPMSAPEARKLLLQKQNNNMLPGGKK